MKGKQPKILVGSTGMTEIMYTGGASGTVSWWGAVTGTQYKAGLKKPRIYVDSRDVDKALSDWREQGEAVFKLAPVAKKPQPVKLPPEPELVAEIEPVVDELPFVDEPEEVKEPEQTIEVEATGGAIELAEEHGIDLAELYDGKKLTVYDVKRYIENSTFDS